MKQKKKQDDDEKYYSESQSEPKVKGNAVIFFGGLMLFAIGAYMIFQNTTASTAFRLSSIIGFELPFGVVLIPLILGIILLFINDNSGIGWFFLIFGVLMVLAGILMEIQMTFKGTNLFVTIAMYGMIAAGIWLTLRGLYKEK